MGKRSFRKTLFKSVKSTQTHHFPFFFLTTTSVSQPLRIEYLFNDSRLLQFVYLYPYCLGVIFGRSPRRLFTWQSLRINVQFVTYKPKVYPWNIISTPCKDINVGLQKLHKLYFFQRCQLGSHLEILLLILSYYPFLQLLEQLSRCSGSLPLVRPFNCYRTGSLIIAVGPKGYCAIADTKHCLVVAWLPTNSPTLP